MPTIKKKQLKKERRVGRPTVMDVDGEVVAKLIEAFKLDATIKEACYYAGINKATYFRHLEKNPNFATKIDGARNYLKLAARRTIGKHIDDPKIAMWYAERKIDDEFIRKEKVDFTGEVNFKALYGKIIDKRIKSPEGSELPTASETGESGNEPGEIQGVSGGEEIREEPVGSVPSNTDDIASGQEGVDSSTDQ